MSGRPEFCAVCADPAIGYHYDVASCSGCRSFFRRSIKQEKQYKCKKQGRCITDAEIANCKSCRFDACVDAGMNPFSLQSADIDIANNATAQMVIAKQAAKRSNTIPVAVAHLPMLPAGPSPSSSVVFIAAPAQLISQADRVQLLIDELLHTKRALDRLRGSGFHPTPYEKYSLDKVFKAKNKMGEEFGSMHDAANLQRIMATKPPITLANNREWKKWWPLCDCICSIEYFRSFPFFELLSRQDQRLLAIHAVGTSTNLTRSYYSVEQRSERIINPDGTPHNDRWQTEVDLEYDCALIDEMFRIGMTETEFALLKAIQCTDFNIVGFSSEGRALLEQYHIVHRKALLSLVMTTRGQIEGPRFFSYALLMLSTLKKITLVKLIEHRQTYRPYVGSVIASPIIDEVLYEEPSL